MAGHSPSDLKTHIRYNRYKNNTLHHLKEKEVVGVGEMMSYCNFTVVLQDITTGEARATGFLCSFPQPRDSPHWPLSQSSILKETTDSAPKLLLCCLFSACRPPAVGNWGTLDFLEADDQSAPSCLSVCTSGWCVSQIYLKAKVEPWKIPGIKDLSKMINQREETFPGCSRCDSS